MARSYRKPRFPFAQTGKFGRLIPTNWQLVVPGESMKEMTIRYRLQSRPLSSPFLGAYVDNWIFYVPLRVLDSTFPTWLLTGVGSPFSDTTVISDTFYEAEAGMWNCHRYAYNQIVNDFFRRPDESAFDIGLTGATSGAAVINMADLPGPFTERDSLAENVQTIETTSSDATTELIAEAFATQRYLDRRDAISQTYEDYLRAQGVRQSGPQVLASAEFLFGSRKWIMPSRTVTPNTGATVQSYMADVLVKKTRPSFFPEHGIVMSVMSVRPKCIVTSCVPVTYAFEDAAPQLVPCADMLEQHDAISFNPQYIGGTGSSGKFTDRLSDLLWHGHHMGPRSVTSSFICEVDVADETNRLRPAAQWDALTSLTLDPGFVYGAYFMDGVVSAGYATPLKRASARTLAVSGAR